jgi:hypothetical protein
LAAQRGKSETWRLIDTVSFNWKSAVFLLEDVNSSRRAALKIIAPNGFPDSASSQFITFSRLWGANEALGTVRVPEPLADLPSVRGFCTAWIDAPGLHQVLTGEVVSPCRKPVGQTNWCNRRWLQVSDRRLALAAVGHWLATFHSIFPNDLERFDAQHLLKAPVYMAIAANAFATRLADHDATFRAALGSLTSMADELDGSEVPFTRLHGDAVAHNFYLDDRGVIGLDLAGVAHGPAAKDLAKLLVSSQFRQLSPTPLHEMNEFGVSTVDFKAFQLGYDSCMKLVYRWRRMREIPPVLLKAHCLAWVLTHWAKLTPGDQPTPIGLRREDMHRRYAQMAAKLANIG